MTPWAESLPPLALPLLAFPPLPSQTFDDMARMCRLSWMLGAQVVNPPQSLIRITTV